MGTSCGQAAQIQGICRHKLEGHALGRPGRATGPGQEAGALPCTLLGLVSSQETHHFVPVVGWDAGDAAMCFEWHKIGLLSPHSDPGLYHRSLTQLRASVVIDTGRHFNPSHDPPLSFNGIFP